MLALAVLGTLIPAGITLGVSYVQSRRAVEQKIRQELSSRSTQTARVIGVWLKEQLYDLRVFASSDEVTNSLSASAATRNSSGRLRDYLRSLHERFPDFDRLVVLDGSGRLAATSGASAPVELPANWIAALRSEGSVIGKPYWDADARAGKMLLAVPVRGFDGRVIGAFAVDVKLAPLQALLRSFAADTVASVYLVTDDGEFIASTIGITPKRLRYRLSPAAVGALTAGGDEATTYHTFEGHEVVGTFARVPQTRWAVVAETPTEQAFGQIRRFRAVSLLVIIALLIVVSISAYRLAVLIVRPLDRLTTGVAEVAGGDLAVDLPETGPTEVRYLTSVFNNMVARLRDGRAELDKTNETLRLKNAELVKLSVTDGLTGLANHRSLMQRLYDESLRSRRTKQPFTTLMADVDHFKDYNDTFGHPAGDDVLKKVAVIMRSATREVDTVARYGGEEFAILLPETSLDLAMEVAERIRTRVESEEFPGRPITVSIGAAEFPMDGDTPPDVITAADKALYEAKRGGRNRTVSARRARARRKSKAE